MSLPCFKTPKAHSIQAQGMSVQAAGHARLLLVSPSSHHSPFSLTFLHASGLWKFSGAFLQIYLSVTSAQEMGSTRLLVGAQWLLIDTRPIQSTQAGRPQTDEEDSFIITAWVTCGSKKMFAWFCFFQDSSNR